MTFVRPRTPAEVMTAAIGEAIENARIRATVATAHAPPAVVETIADAWRRASNSLDAFIIADPSASHDGVIEAFARVAR